VILGRLDEGGGYKGHCELIEAWPEVVRRIPEACLTIVGDGPGRDVIEGLARASAARERIALTGLVPERELHEILSRCSALAMPSRGEGFGLAYAEAMRHGVPVIASVHDAAREVNADRVSGFNVDLDQPGELSGRIVELLAQPALARVLSLGARQRWHDHMRYTRFAERFRPIVRSLWNVRPV
jgi:phosphatidylinositol alpha-1,6-mannosyltransferase